MGIGHKLTLFQRRHTNGQQVRETMLSVTTHQGNATGNHNEIAPHTSDKKQVLLRMWQKRKPQAVLVRPWVGVATVENSMEAPQKLKIELPHNLAISLLGIFPQNTKTLIWKDICLPSMSIAALFTIGKEWKRANCSVLNEWIKIWCVCVCEILHSHKKESTLAICNSMDGPRGYYAKWNASDRERQMPCDFT